MVMAGSPRVLERESALAFAIVGGLEERDRQRATIAAASAA